MTDSKDFSSAAGKPEDAASTADRTDVSQKKCPRKCGNRNKNPSSGTSTNSNPPKTKFVRRTAELNDNIGSGNDSSSHDSYQEIALERKSLRESRHQLWMWTFFIFLVNIAIHEIHSNSQLLDGCTPSSTSSIVATSSMAIIIDDKTTTKKNTTMDNNNNNNNIIYGHLHIPKTGGTTLNGLMAAKYERVCGNKGYSHDAYQANIRAFEEGKERSTGKGSSGNAWNYNSKNLGFEDCDYSISAKNALGISGRTSLKDWLRRQHHRHRYRNKQKSNSKAFDNSVNNSKKAMIV